MHLYMIEIFYLINNFITTEVEALTFIEWVPHKYQPEF